jgi:putative endopeptidase
MQSHFRVAKGPPHTRPTKVLPATGGLANNIRGRALNPFRPATLVVALSLAFAGQVSFGADAAASAGAPVAAAPLAGTELGLDKSGMDPAVRPQDDLFLAMNGAWVKKTEIPADKSSWGTFYQLRELSDQRVKDIIEELASKPQAAGTINAKIGDFYSSYMDTAAIDAAGTRPLAPFKAQLAAVKNKKDLVLLMGKWVSFADLPLGLGVGPDAKDPTIYSAGAGQGGLGLGDRDYYLKTDARFAKAREAYVTYMRTLLTLDGDKNAVMDAKAVMALEMKLAKVQWSQEANRDPIKTYNPMTLKELAAKAPSLDWRAYLEAGDLPDPAFVSIAQPDYTWALVKMIKDEPIDVWKAYMRVRMLDGTARELPAGFRDAAYQFHDVAITGVKQDKPRWQRGVAALNGAMGEAVGQVYVSKYFPPAYKARMVQLVDNLLKTYAASIDNLTWMSPTTKVEAHAKLAKYGVKIGYPDVWRDYGALEVKAGDPIGNSMRAAEFEYHREAVRNGKPVDHTEWGMTPQTVNAYYDPQKNEVVFPAAILQPPFFDMKADDAVNYGAIGAVIGHEISHGFDDQGSQFDGDGKLRNWWTPEDRKAFEAITSRLDAQYSAYSPLPGTHLNGKLTMGENIADLSGLQISYKAWKMSLNGQPSPTIDGLTGEQRFYYGFSQVWRAKVRDERTLQLVVIDPHSPAQFRADGAAINSDGFHDAFGTKPGDKMWKAPADRLRLW